MEIKNVIGALRPLVTGVVAFVITTSKAIADGFFEALNKRLDSEAWLENFLNYANTVSTLGAVVAGAFGISENSHITTAMAVGLFAVFYKISLSLRIRLEALKDRKEHELAEKIVKALVAELEDEAGSA